MMVLLLFWLRGYIIQGSFEVEVPPKLTLNPKFEPHFSIVQPRFDATSFLPSAAAP